MIGHVCPEAWDKGCDVLYSYLTILGPIAAIQDGDVITIDPVKKELSVAVSEEELKERIKNVKLPEKPAKGVLGKYRKLVTGADKGACTV